MKVKDIAAKHGLSETNVKQKLFRARKKIMHLSMKKLKNINVKNFCNLFEIRTLYKQGGNQYDK